MKIAIIPNLSKANAADIALRAGDMLKKLGATPVLCEDMAELNSGGFELAEADDIFNICDVAIAIGGDGTIIHVAKSAARFGKATLGINAGRIGYLAGLEPNELKDLSKLISGDYSVSERMLLKACVDGKEFYCLNDAVISRGALSRMVDISVEINGSSMVTRADGIIVATPTGSTAYSMSAGGPVVDPSVGGIVLSYICPQSPGTRSVVLGKESKLSIRAVAAEDTEMFLTVDGEQAYKLAAESRVDISDDTEHSVKLISIKGEPFWHVLSRKIK